MSVFSNSQEYNERCRTPFVPPTFSLKELRAAVPEGVFVKSTTKGVYHVLRILTLGAVLWYIASYIETDLPWKLDTPRAVLLRWICWSLYWLFQSLVGGGLWTLGHEAGHGTLSPHRLVNNVLGFLLHTIMLVPYFSWRWTHHMHHKGAASLEKDENYVPRTRADLKLSYQHGTVKVDYHRVFEESPAYAAGRLLFMSLLGFQAYLLCNTLGNPKYPRGTNHLSLSSALFPPEYRHLIVASNLGMGAMVTWLLFLGYKYGLFTLVKYYFMPYIFANAWVVILTFLQHTDPSVPHYRKDQWSFVRGSLATVDRPFLGWLGRFFLNNIAHDHTAHHLFSNVPFYNLPTVTQHIKPILKEHYCYDSTSFIHALWRSFTQCVFVENEGEVLFYKNREGKLARNTAIPTE